MKFKLNLIMILFLFFHSSFAQENRELHVTVLEDNPELNYWGVGLLAGGNIGSPFIAAGVGLYGRYDIKNRVSIRANFITEVGGYNFLVEAPKTFNSAQPYQLLELRGSYFLNMKEKESMRDVQLASRTVEGFQKKIITTYYAKDVPISIQKFNGITFSFIRNNTTFGSDRDSSKPVGYELGWQGKKANAFVPRLIGFQSALILTLGYTFGNRSYFKGNFTGDISKKKSFIRSTKAYFDFMYSVSNSIGERGYSDEHNSQYEIWNPKFQKWGFKLGTQLNMGKPGIGLRLALGIKPGVKQYIYNGLFPSNSFAEVGISYGL